MSLEHWLMDGIIYTMALLGLIAAWREEKKQ